MAEEEVKLPKVPPIGGSSQRIPTNREIWTLMNELHAAYLLRQTAVDTAIDLLSTGIKKVEQRMTTYEKNLEETGKTLQTNTVILKAQTETLDEIKKLVPFITGLITVLKWCAGLITTILGGLIIAVIVHFLL